MYLRFSVRASIICIVSRWFALVGFLYNPLLLLLFIDFFSLFKTFHTCPRCSSRHYATIFLIIFFYPLPFLFTPFINSLRSSYSCKYFIFSIFIKCYQYQYTVFFIYTLYLYRISFIYPIVHIFPVLLSACVLVSIYVYYSPLFPLPYLSSLQLQTSQTHF